MDEKEIIKLIIKGDNDKFAHLVKKHQDMVFKTCMGFVHCSDDANDLTQDVFINAFQNLKKFNQQSAFSTWIYRIAVNASLNAVRAKKRNLFQRFDNLFGQESKQESYLNSDYLENPESGMITNEQEAMVVKEIDKLSEKQKIAFVLSRCDNLPQKEIAAIMNISEGAVESLVQRAKANLAKNLSNYFKKK